ncbi:PPE family protein [Mycobacterium asiaticum DSM 44297]|uniref:PPE family protein n=2 Tax=Mycobacterium asiaticum TaxID=1790 RepID=UPI0009F3C048|nr:PPE family protein [Mycobacterium asiaticum]ORA12383.1 PPE family protein [Mycobacterium asiaticum DSM 44297]
MAAPIWMASPPEIHSALLSSGPGPAALLAAAGAWQALGAEYADATAELLAVLGAAQSAWEGPSAAEYVIAHAPYLAWLTQAQAKSDAAALQQEAAAAAYTTALAAMPTLGELAANHVVHGVLVATNFFGINTVPIAVNEADYVRMWIQAATTMSTYDAVSSAVLGAVPQTMPAPAVLKSEAVAPTQMAAAGPAADAGTQLNFSDLISQLLQGYINYVQQLFAPITDFLQDPLGNSVKLITDFLTNPSQALITWGPLLSAVAYQVFSNVGAALTYPQLLLQPLLAITLGVVAGVGQQLLALGPAAAAAAGEVAVPAAVALTGHSAVLPLAGLAPSGVTSAAAPAASAAGAGAPAPTAAAPAAAGPLVPYAVPGLDPGGGFTPTLRDRTAAKAPAEGIPAAAAGVSAREKRRARRRRTDTMPEFQYGDEFMDFDDPDAAPVEEPSVAASSRGAGTMGFGGTVAKDDADATGLMTLASDSFGGSPTIPMLPTTWDRNEP